MGSSVDGETLPPLSLTDILPENQTLKPLCSCILRVKTAECRLKATYYIVYLSLSLIIQELRMLMYSFKQCVSGRETVPKVGHYRTHV